jgi:hypothetical protein
MRVVVLRFLLRVYFAMTPRRAEGCNVDDYDYVLRPYHGLLERHRSSTPNQRR